LMVRRAPLSDIISLHASVTAVAFLGPLVLGIARIFKRPVVFRMFGGMGYDGVQGLQSLITKSFCRRCDLYLAQTKALVSDANRDGIVSVKWFPTSRPVCEDAVKARQPTQKCRRFVFVGQLRVEKGLLVLIQAAEGLPKDCVVDVYGPWGDLPKDAFCNSKRVRYCGVVAPDDVTATMKRYDALVLPSFLKAEGYAGVVFEAYSVGLPVIATRWNALPEIVLNGQTGLLVEPMDAASLCAAMIQLAQDDALFALVSEGAACFGRQFSTESQAGRFVSYCLELVKTEAPGVAQRLPRSASAAVSSRDSS
jgi:glycosyltransferase involved in cell wall biosynthesis